VLRPERQARRTTVSKLWQGWKRLARRIADVQARVTLTVFYFLIVAPFALAVRAFSDPLRFAAPPAWSPRDAAGADTSAHARRQY
jgi:hypothetical protein